jgi:hypothetical protein
MSFTDRARAILAAVWRPISRLPVPVRLGGGAVLAAVLLALFSQPPAPPAAKIPPATATAPAQASAPTASTPAPAQASTPTASTPAPTAPAQTAAPATATPAPVQPAIPPALPLAADPPVGAVDTVTLVVKDQPPVEIRRRAVTGQALAVADSSAERKRDPSGWDLDRGAVVVERAGLLRIERAGPVALVLSLEGGGECAASVGGVERLRFSDTWSKSSAASVILAPGWHEVSVAAVARAWMGEPRCTLSVRQPGEDAPTVVQLHHSEG